MSPVALEVVSVLWNHRGHHDQDDPDYIRCEACDKYIGDTYSHVIDHQVDMLAAEGLLTNRDES
jgi:hypothetical protein